MVNETSKYNGVYKDIAEEFGYEVAEQFFKSFRGLNINFPMRLYSQNFIIGALKEEYDGTNLKELARKYGYSDRWIRKLISSK